MKAKFYFCFVGHFTSGKYDFFAREMKSLRQIELRNKIPAQHRSIPISPIAFVESPMVSIDLLSPVNTRDNHHKGCRNRGSGLYIY